MKKGTTDTIVTQNASKTHQLMQTAQARHRLATHLSSYSVAETLFFSSSSTLSNSTESVVLSADHLSTTRRTWPLTILMWAFWHRSNAPSFKTAACASERTDKTTEPVSSPTRASLICPSSTAAAALTQRR